VYEGQQRVNVIRNCMWQEQKRTFTDLTLHNIEKQGGKTGLKKNYKCRNIRKIYLQSFHWQSIHQKTTENIVTIYSPSCNFKLLLPDEQEILVKQFFFFCFFFTLHFQLSLPHNLAV